MWWVTLPPSSPEHLGAQVLDSSVGFPISVPFHPVLAPSEHRANEKKCSLELEKAYVIFKFLWFFFLLREYLQYVISNFFRKNPLKYYQSLELMYRNNYWNISLFLRETLASITMTEVIKALITFPVFTYQVVEACPLHHGIFMEVHCHRGRISSGQRETSFQAGECTYSPQQTRVITCPESSGQRVWNPPHYHPAIILVCTCAFLHEFITTFPSGIYPKIFSKFLFFCFPV